MLTLVISESSADLLVKTGRLASFVHRNQQESRRSEGRARNVELECALSSAAGGIGGTVSGAGNLGRTREPADLEREQAKVVPKTRREPAYQAPDAAFG